MRKAIPILAGVLLVASCAAPRPVPPPRVAVVPPPRPLVPSVPQPVGSDWRDWPLTPGDWRYSSRGGTTEAAYGSDPASPLLTLRCNRGAQPGVQLVLGGAIASTAWGPSEGATVRTTSISRMLPMTVAAGSPSTALAANDALLDAIAFSRGRFVVDAHGQTLVLPVYAEIGRVIEDCRG